MRDRLFYIYKISDVLFNCCFICTIQDSTFEFERKRNRPERYDRNLTEETLRAIKKIDKLRAERESRHIAYRFYIFFIAICCMPICYGNTAWRCNSGLFTFAGCEERRQRSSKRHGRNWTRASIWSKHLLLSRRILHSHFQRSRSRCHNHKQSKISLWKNEFVTLFCHYIKYPCHNYFSAYLELLPKFLCGGRLSCLSLCRQVCSVEAHFENVFFNTDTSKKIPCINLAIFYYLFIFFSRSFYFFLTVS